MDEDEGCSNQNPASNAMNAMLTASLPVSRIRRSSQQANVITEQSITFIDRVVVPPSNSLHGAPGHGGVEPQRLPGSSRDQMVISKHDLSNELSRSEIGLRVFSEDFPHTGRFRLFTLYPGERFSPICGDLDEYEPKQKLPTYTALSYCWGRESRLYSLHITCRGIIKITANCYDALRNLRSRTKKRILWIDSICIHQGSAKDKALQVGNMGAIYQKAEKCIAYVGEENTTTRELFEYARSASGCHSIDGSVLHRFMDRPWFSRVWVIQEVLLSEKLYLQCGRNKLPWDQFCSAYETLVCRFTDCFDVVSTPMSLLELKHWYVASVSGFDYANLLDVLLATRQFECKDPRDRLFGLLSLFHGAPPNLVSPNYAQDSGQTWNRLSEYLIRHRDWRALGAAQGTFADQWSASWALNLEWLHKQPHPFGFNTVQHIKRPTTTSGAHEVEFSYESTIPPNLFPYGFVKISSPALRYHHRLPAMSIQSRVIDKVVIVCPMIIPDSFDADGMSGIKSCWMKQLQQHVEKNKQPPIREENCFSGFLPITLKDIIAECLNWVHRPDGLSLLSEEVLKREWSTIKEQRLFFTRSGLVGLGHKVTHVGDSVCFVGGHYLPVVLFQHNDTHHWQLVGPCVLGFQDKTEFQNASLITEAGSDSKTIIMV